MTDGKYGYKIDGLKAILGACERTGFEAKVKHYMLDMSPINIDAEAMRCLIRHYARRNRIEPDDRLPDFSGAKFEIGKFYRSATMDSIKVVNRRNGYLYFTHADGGATLRRKIYEHGNETEVIRFHPDHKDCWFAKDVEVRE